MRRRGWMCLIVASAAAWGGSHASADMPSEVAASAPTDVAVTIYRDPYRNAGSMNLNWLGGFALVSETRSVSLPAGESRLRFEGVADGIEPQSALVTGLANGVLEKNRDAALLSPSTLLAAAVGTPVALLRTDRKSGRQQRLDATILSDAGNGVVFKTDEGIEALRCSGLPETFTFQSVDGLRSQPTLSVLVRMAQPYSGQVVLAYLAHGFDWSADYRATLAADERHMDLGAWVTLANGNGEGFPSAHANVVAGRVNHESGDTQPIELGGPILATCWARGSTSDLPIVVTAARKQSRSAMIAPAPMMAMSVTAASAAATVEQEQLGDLKLYRVPERTSVASRQSKQVRLLDKAAIPIDSVYGAQVQARQTVAPRPAMRLLRTRNDLANHLGVPLPSGKVAVFGMHGGGPLLEHESALRDLAVDEDVEIAMGPAADVEVSAAHEAGGERVNISNARATRIVFELTLEVDAGLRVVQPSRPMSTKNGRPFIRFEIPAQSNASLQYQLQKDAVPGR